MSSTPKVLMTTTDGNVLLSEFRGQTSTLSECPSQLLIAELVPDRYGIVICKYDATANPPVDPAAPDGTYLSVDMDDAFRFSCTESLFSVDISVFEFATGDWTLHYHLLFADAFDWFECVRLLSDGKAKHALFGKRVRTNLAAAAVMAFDA